ncbi:translation initiation factor IF-5A [Candidatus Woesearchaeota archaeon]|nr:MAG: translation initiation factor IF-5A [Candidatus Woesearchaeota archaeon]
MSTKVVGAGSVKEGSFIVIDGVACKVVSAETSKSGKHGHAKARIMAIGLLDNKKREIVMPASDNVDVPIIEKKSAQVLSVTGDMANVMDDESFETFDLKIPEELKESVVPNCKILYWTILGERVMKQLKGGAE